MRKLLVLVALMGLTASAAAQEPKQPEKEPTLKVGDKAPPIAATKWLQGTEVKEFAKGKTYVVEFWATWCGPCIVMMPHMGELQRLYKDKGVTFIGFTVKDDNNKLEKVTAMVEKRGPALGYTFAYADDSNTYDAWMKASGQQGIPCCFVVDKEGKIAFIGHPMYLDVVLPKVVEGKWTEKDLETIKKIEEEVTAVFMASGDSDPEVFLKALGDFEKKYPELAGIPYFNGPRISSLLKAKKIDEAKKLCDALVAKGLKTSDDRLLSMVSGALRTDANGDKELLALALKAAETQLKIAGDKDWIALLSVAGAHFAVGDTKKAQEFGAKAVAATETESPALKKYVEMQVKKFDDKKETKE